MGTHASGTLGVKLAFQWVILYVDDKHAFRAGKAKINTFPICTDFQQIQKPTPFAKRYFCHHHTKTWEQLPNVSNNHVAQWVFMNTC